MGKITKTITIQMPVTAAYKIVKEREAQTYPLLKGLDAVSAVPIEDIPNLRYATEVKQYGTSAKVFYNFKPAKNYTEIIINVEYGWMFKEASGKFVMEFVLTFLKAVEMGYIAALEGGTEDIPDICKKCGKELSREFAVCPFCGTPR